ncbi:MAG: methyltransferase domain-containing protein [Janthinobacterium lividum]
MLATKIIYGIYNSVKNILKSAYNFLTNFSGWYKDNLLAIKENFAEIKYRFHNLSESNLKLGIYHLTQQNLTDAVIRFKLIDKFIKPGDNLANYWLGWSYFLKNDINKALYHLGRAGKEDNVGLEYFARNYSNCQEIPEAIWQQYRNIIADKWANINILENKETYLPSLFAQYILKNINNLPDNYNILEISTSIGMIGGEMRKRFPENFTLTGIEASENMLDIIKANNSFNDKIYDYLIHSSSQNFVANYSNIQTPEKKFDIVISFLGLSFTSTPDKYLNFIYSILRYDGYVAICFAAGSTTLYSTKKKEFVFDRATIEDSVTAEKLSLLEFREVILGINNKYYIYILKKL